MVILHIIPQIGSLTGAELYVSDLAKKQVSFGHTVAIYSTSVIRGEPLKEIVSSGVELLDDLDDGFDVVHAHQAQSAMIGSILDVPVIQTIHSELFTDLEYPVTAKNIVHHICVRPSIQEKFKDVLTSSSVIFNGVDESRFFPTKYAKDSRKTVLFVGPNDYLRKRAIGALVDMAYKDQINLILVGRNQDIKSKNVIALPEMRSIELITQRVDMTASVMLGRTTIEGWLCGKPGMVFTVNESGSILDQDVLPVPSDITPYTLSYMAEKIEELYARYIHSNIR
jgi:glycosyltransferase involved in cell wall biosynthesis